MTPSFPELRDIFYSGQYAYQSDLTTIEMIYDLLDQRVLLYSQCILADKSDFLELAESLPKQLQVDAAGGGSTHIALKQLSATWLRAQGYESKYEQPFCGYYPDVITTDQQTIIECGHTDNPEKLLSYFTQGSIAELIQVSYTTVEDKMVIGHRFSAAPGLKLAIGKLQRKDKQTILDIMNRPDR